MGLDNKIIVIGNGTSVLDRKMGSVIDTFEDVVRINSFQIKGYETFIGSKTTIWARNNSKRTKNRIKMDQYKRIIICSPDWNMNRAFKIQKTIPGSEVIPKKIVANLQRDLNQSLKKSCHSGKPKKWPSTGLLLLYYLLGEYDPIHIYGFDNFKGKNGVARHYYNNKEKIISWGVHECHKERSWIKNKILEGKIINIGK